MPATASPRFYLRVAAKLLGLVTLGVFAWVLLSDLLPRPGGSSPTLAIPIAQLPPDLLRLQWAGRRLLVLRRDPATVARLHELDPSLAHPGPLHSGQADLDTAPGRSHAAEFFVALDYDPDFGCPVEYVPVTAAAPVAPWLGGFRAPCSGSWFDLAGRVYRGQRTVHNLQIPPHRVADGHIVVGE